MSKKPEPYPRSLDDDFKLSYRSIAEVYEAFGRLERLVGVDKSIRFKGKVRPKGSAILNALILYVASLEPERQRDIVRQGIGSLNDLLRLPAEGEAKPPAVPEAPAREGAPKTRVRNGPGSLPGKGRANGAG